MQQDLPTKLKKDIDIWVNKFPQEKKRSSLLMALKLAQDEYGWLSDQTIDAVADYLKYYPVTTLFTEMSEEEQLKPSTVKMVRSGDTALWFGRGITGYGDWHLGIYGYRSDALSLYPSLEVTQEERVEKLEQLRWLKAGWTIGCTKVDFNGVEINTQEDIHLWNYKNEQVQDRSVGITQNQTI